VSRLTIVCRDFKPLRRNTLIGFATVRVAELRLEIHGIAIHQKGTARWCQLPAKPLVRDGALVKDAYGKIQYVPMLAFDARRVADAFSAAVVAALLDVEPHAFNEEAEVMS